VVILERPPWRSLHSTWSNFSSICYSARVSRISSRSWHSPQARKNYWSKRRLFSVPTPSSFGGNRVLGKPRIAGFRYPRGLAYRLRRVERCGATSSESRLHMGLINIHGRDAFCRRVSRAIARRSTYRAIGATFPHRLLARSKGGLFAWEAVRHFSIVILGEGLFNRAVLWQAGFRNTTCAFGLHRF
jgi:hypothetical protein